MPLCFASFKLVYKIFLLSFLSTHPQGYLSISPWVTNEKFWGLLSTIHFHSRAASQPRNLDNCHTLVKFMGDNCPQINNSICKMPLGLGWGKNPVSSAVYSVKNFNSLLYNAYTLFLKFSFFWLDWFPVIMLLKLYLLEGNKMNIKKYVPFGWWDNGCFIPKCPIFPTFSIKTCFFLKSLFQYVNIYIKAQMYILWDPWQRLAPWPNFRWAPLGLLYK